MEMEKSIYYTDENVRESIDAIQEKIASVEAHTGKDSTPTDLWEAGKLKTKYRLLIKSLDESYYKKISTVEEIEKGI